MNRHILKTTRDRLAELLADIDPKRYPLLARAVRSAVKIADGYLDYRKETHDD